MWYNSATKCVATVKTVNRSESDEKLIRCESNYSYIVITFLTCKILSRNSYMIDLYMMHENRDFIGGLKKR